MILFCCVQFPYVTSVKRVTNSDMALGEVDFDSGRVKSWVATGKTGLMPLKLYNISINSLDS